ncbi:D-xylose transport system permease protein [Saccharopolyspora kobensis]|uniref:Xylose transport system permease protein XylH n=1 Tax=Saccharopolyspora kobensis TaxID=146035 RepID=A0A1H5Y3G1_9PSEU|nr:ABC transporter permease [Saccharopolyspora kobensis]SEG18554.1 D-xylose transport system permease protein [Saccharopolyspora kobensis]SFF08899.1 D-xylose transport system permease protein [Saccharopolyspora kobensis]
MTERVSTPVADFGIDTTSRGTGEAVRDYVGKLRRGDLGALPALVVLAALLVLFTALSEDFLTLNNLANLLQHGAGQTIIAMGLVYVLLLGEIDLSAGTASGVSASLLALHFQHDGNLLGAMGTAVFAAFALALAGAALLALLLRIWLGAVLSALALVLLVGGFGANPWLEMLLAVSTGAAIGCVTGFAVSKVRIPSFIVTLGLFITWSGVVLQLVGPGGTISVRESPELFAVANGNLGPAASWALFGIAGAGYAAVVGHRHLVRLRHGLVAQPTALVVAKVVAVLGCGGLATFLLVLDRSPHPELASVRGMPLVVPIILVLLVVGTHVLDRTRYGRHLRAIGDNRVAAHRAGVEVARVRMTAFVICSSIAAVGAIVYTSKTGSVDGSAGGGNLVLFAVGAAVIGGTSLFGGKGRPADAVLGGAVLATVQNGLNLLGFPAAPVNVITGLVLVAAAGADALSRRRSAPPHER